MICSLLAAYCTLGAVAPPPVAVLQAPAKPAVTQKNVPKPPPDIDEDTFDLPTDPKHKADLEADVKSGKKYQEEVLKEEKLSTNQDYQNRVEKVGQILAHVANHNHVQATWGDKRLNPYHYHYKVLQGDDINAFSLPGGYIFVYEGLMKFVESDDELAGVLAHETAHAAFRHVATLQRESNKISWLEIPAIIAAILTHSGDALAGAQLVLQNFGSGWSINAEKAADYGGFQYMTRSPYNPVAMLTFMERLAAKERYMSSLERTLGIYQTHPLTRQRADAMVANLHEAGIPIERSKASPSYRVTMKPGTDGAVSVVFHGRTLYTFGGLEAKERAETTVKRLNRFFDSVPDLFEVNAKEDEITWKDQVLIAMQPEDAQAAGTTPEKLLNSSFVAIKDSLYGLAYRVWDGL